MQKIGILGGTFNPIHTGHLILAEHARTELSLDEIWFIPTGCSYLKDERTIAPGMHRLRMVELAIEDNSYMKALDIEIERHGNTYSYETLEELSRLHPDKAFYFIVGADCLFSIERWKCPDRIFKASTLVAGVRGNTTDEAMKAQKERLEQMFAGKVELLSLPNIEISSTVVRTRLQGGISAKYLVPDRVLQYIKEKGLYLNESI